MSNFEKIIATITSLIGACALLIGNLDKLITSTGVPPSSINGKSTPSNLDIVDNRLPEPLSPSHINFDSNSIDTNKQEDKPSTEITHEILASEKIAEETIVDIPGKHSVTLKVDPAADLSILINDSEPSLCSSPCIFDAPVGATVHWVAKHSGYEEDVGDLTVSAVDAENIRERTLERSAN